MESKPKEDLRLKNTLEFVNKSKYVKKYDHFNFNIDKIKAEFLSIFYEIKVWSKDDANLYDFKLTLLRL